MGWTSDHTPRLHVLVPRFSSVKESARISLIGTSLNTSIFLAHVALLLTNSRSVVRDVVGARRVCVRGDNSHHGCY